jgi:hypothetical protein
MNSIYLRCLLGLVVASPAACSTATSDEDTGATSAEQGGSLADGTFVIFPGEVFTGTDGSHAFKAPVVTLNASGRVTWMIADPDVAQLAPEAENVMITAKKPGDTVITAKNGNKTSTAQVHVVSYTTRQYEDGMNRYLSGVDADNPACKDCHARSKAPDHTSTELDAYSDSQVEDTFIRGVDPERRPIKDNAAFADVLNGSTHTWMVADSEQVGLVAYLRSLPPMGFPEFDVPTSDKTR